MQRRDLFTTTRSFFKVNMTHELDATADDVFDSVKGTCEAIESEIRTVRAAEVRGLRDCLEDLNRIRRYVAGAKEGCGQDMMQ